MSQAWVQCGRKKYVYPKTNSQLSFNRTAGFLVLAGTTTKGDCYLIASHALSTVTAYGYQTPVVKRT